MINNWLENLAIQLKSALIISITFKQMRMLMTFRLII